MFIIGETNTNHDFLNLKQCKLVAVTDMLYQLQNKKKFCYKKEAML